MSQISIALEMAPRKSPAKANLSNFLRFGQHGPQPRNFSGESPHFAAQIGGRVYWSREKIYQKG